MLSRSPVGLSVRALLVLASAARTAPAVAQAPPAAAAAPAQASAIAPPGAVPALFQRDCAPCHGDRAEGGIAPQLAGRPLIPQTIATRVRQGGLVMPAFPAARISDPELQALEAYIGSLAPPTAAELLPSPAASAPGATLFQGKCLACHGAEARGGPIGPGILNTALPLPRFLSQVRHGGGLMPPFAADQLTDAQAQAIYAYLHPALPRPDAGTVYPLPSMPAYVSDFLFALALVAILAQVGSERRRRVRRSIQVEAEQLRAWDAPTGDERVAVRAF